MLSFGLVLATAIVASSIALYTYNRFAESFSNIADKSVPFMAESMEKTRLAMQVSAVTPLLVSSGSREESSSHRTSIIEILEQVDSNLQHATDTDVLSMKQREEQVAELRMLVNQLAELVVNRISNEDKIANVENQINTLYLKTNQQLLDIIDTATFEFVIYSEELFGESVELIDSLLNENVDAMVSALRLEVNVNKLVALKNSVVPSLSVEEQMQKKEQIASLIASVANEREKLSEYELEKLQSIAQSIDYISQAVTDSGADQSVMMYNLGRAPVVDEQLSIHNDSVTSVLSTIVAERYLATQQSGKTLAESLNDTLPGMMSDGIDNLLGLLELRVELKTINGVLAQVSKVASVADLQPLIDVYTAAKEKIEENLSVIQASEELDAVAENFNSLFRLGDISSGLFQQTTELLTSKNGVKAGAQALSLVQNSFIDQLVTQVQSSKKTVADASLGVKGLIENSRLQLLSVSLLSIVFTVFVFWSLVSRNILRRLLQTIDALRSLADDNYDVSVDVSGKDELSSLAQTFEVFRQKSLEAVRLQEERQVLSDQQQADEKRSQAEKLKVLEDDTTTSSEGATCCRSRERKG